jgi:hypothetical protein
VHDALDRRTLLVATVAFFVVAFFAFAFFYLRMAILWDADSYYHLAVARLYAQSGISATIPWARFSLLSNGGDKDFLFHVLLMPFTVALDPAIGGRLALALLNASIATAVANLAARAIGLWGFAVPFWLWIAAPPFFTRIVRLRPELIALLVILIAIPYAAKRRWIVLGVLAAVFTWSYTAFHVFLALCVIWWLVDRLAKRSTQDSGLRTQDSATDPKHEEPPTSHPDPREGVATGHTSPGGRGWRDRRSAAEEGAPGEGRAGWQALLWPFAGVAIALLARPHPIENLKIWFVQNVTFFMNVSRLDVGPEIRPPSLMRAGVASAAWIAALAVLAVIAMRSRERAHPLARYAAVPAILFAVLFFGMVRMATYFYPLATIAILLAIGPRFCASIAKHEPSERRLSAGQRIRGHALPLTLALSTLISIPLALNPTFVHIISGAPVLSEADWEAFGKAVPRGAKVAATWGDAEIYALWAPQGRYLDVLDPVFMAVPFPRQYAVQRAIFAGVHPDIAFAAKEALDSDFVALDWSDAPPMLIERMKSDPRLRVRYGGFNVLAQIVPSDAFVVDWTMVDGGAKRYPLTPPPLRAFEGFVNARRVTPARCATFVRNETGPLQFAFAPYGQSAVAVDGRVLVTSNGTAANLARPIPVAIPAGPHRIEIRTCEASGFNGFFFLKAEGRE